MSGNILSRKISLARQTREAQGNMAPTKALRRSIARGADELWGLALVGQGIGHASLSQDECVALLRPDDLLVLLEGPGGLLGLAALDRSLVMGLVEVQTIGIVLALGPDDRAYTPTDAAMVAPLLDITFEGLEAILGTAEDRLSMSGFRFGAMLDDARMAGLVLEAPRFDVFTIDVDLSNGTKSGLLKLAFPSPEKAGVGDGGGQTDAPYETGLALLQAELRVDLPSVRMPIAKVQDLRPGMVFPISAEGLGRAALVAASSHILARGRVGQLAGHWAIKLDIKGQPGPSRPKVSRRNVEPKTLDLAEPDAPQPDFPDLPDLPELQDLPAMDVPFDTPMAGELLQIDIADQEP